MRVAMFLCLWIACITIPAFAQYDAAIFGSSTYIVLFDSHAGKSTTLIAQSTVQQSRGAMFGPTGLIYMSAWTTNGIEVLDPVQRVWIKSLAVADPTNNLMGAPYQPAPNYDNLGAFGVWCVDGNPPPTSLNPPANSRNSFVVDYSVSPPTFRADGFFPNTDTPMSDAFANPYGPGFLCVGFAASDRKIDIYPLASTPPSTISLTNVLTLPMDSQYDATFAEDGNLYVLGANNMMVCDIRNKKVTTIQIKGLPIGYGALWSAPWEQPGMKGWIASDIDDTVYALDLMAAPMVVTSLMKFPFPAPLPHTNWSFNTARSAEECQLCSWKSDLKGKRNFHVNFGSSALGQPCVLVPSLLGLRRNPMMLSGLEIYLAIDNASILGLQGLLPYPGVVYLGTSGEADILWSGFGNELGIRSYWQALTFNKGGKFTDASNIINVGL